MTFCTNGCGQLGYLTDEEARRHLVALHPMVARERFLFEPSDVPDPLVSSKIQVAGECWRWTGAINPNGYGHFVRRKGLAKQTKTYAHRHVYAAFFGEIPAKHEVHHSCGNRWCCRPEHLHLTTHEVNSGPGMRVLDRARLIPT